MRMRAEATANPVPGSICARSATKVSLDRLLAQEVVDAEDRVAREGAVDRGVQRAGGLQVLAERLLEDDLRVAGEPRAGQLVDDRLGALGRHREVEQHLRVRQLAAQGRELVDEVAVVAAARRAHRHGEAVPALGAPAPELLDRPARVLAHVVVVERASGDGE
jgi:hypothetical protein